MTLSLSLRPLAPLHASRRVALLCCAAALFWFGAGCAEEKYAPAAQDPPDASAPDLRELPDLGHDMIVAPDPDLPPTPRRLHPTLSVGSSGGKLSTPNHRARILIGPPTPAGRLQSARHRVLLGPGPAQHGQK